MPRCVWPLSVVSANESFLCSFVQFGENAGLIEERMAEAIKATWAPNIQFLRGGIDSFWHDLPTSSSAASCSWFLWVSSVQTYVNIPVVKAVLRSLDSTQAWTLRLFPQANSEALLFNRALVQACGGSSAVLHCCAALASCQLRDVQVNGSARAGVSFWGYHSFASRDPEDCLLGVLNVRGWVHLQQIHGVLYGPQHLGAASSPACASITLAPGVAAGTEEMGEPTSVASALESQPQIAKLQGPLCIFVPVHLPLAASTALLDSTLDMVRAVQETWITSSTTFVLPPRSRTPEGLLQGLLGLRSLHIPESGEDNLEIAAIDGLYAMRFWRLVLRPENEANGACLWSMKLPLSSYLNAPALERRLQCFDPSLPWYLGVTTAAYSAGADPFMFPSEKAGTILSQALHTRVHWWMGICLTRWSQGSQVREVPWGSEAFFADYAVALCLADVGAVEAKNYADIEMSFILFDRPAQTRESFALHPDTVKQCLLVVGALSEPEDLRRVHREIGVSNWHEGVPCIGESQTGSFSISDGVGNRRPYYDEGLRLALYYCKNPEMLQLEQELAARLGGVDPRSGLGAPSKRASPAERQRRYLCIFVPSSARKESFVRAAETAWEHWGTPDTFFVSTKRLSPALDSRTLQLEGDMDTDYAHLPVRTFRLFEALGRPEWVEACDWYMKADADSFLNVPLIEQRLRCFDPGDLWFLGVPQVAHSSSGSMTRFASGGAGYLVSRALLPKLAAWSPFCLLQLLQHTGGTGMEDVALAGCLWKWGEIAVVSYIDPDTEAVTSEAAFERTRLREEQEQGQVSAIPSCVFVAHSLTPLELARAHENIGRAQQQAEALGSSGCRPDPERLRMASQMVLSPASEGLPVHQWPVLARREFEALMHCSLEAI